jgi:hypothetical protein
VVVVVVGAVTGVEWVVVEVAVAPGCETMVVVVVGIGTTTAGFAVLAA